MRLNGKKVLVVGGGGYIGSHVCKKISEEDGIPITFDNFSSGHFSAIKYGPLFEGDLRSIVSVNDAIGIYEPDAVVHLASNIEVGLGEKDPTTFYSNNVNGTLNLLRAMKDNAIKKIIFSSTCAVYGERQSMPLTERSIPQPVSTYGRTKLASEYMIKDFAKAHGMSYVNFRYFNAAGADPSGEIGERHDPETHLIPIALEVAAGKRDRLSIFGRNWPTKDGTCIRDYIHVNDIAEAHVLALLKMEERQLREDINLSSGRGYSVLEIASKVASVTKTKIPLKFDDFRPGDVAELRAVSSKAEQILGFVPQHSSIDNIIQTAWNFHRSQT